MSNEQITQETVPVDQATTEAQPQATQTTVTTADTPAPQPTESSWKESISEAYRNDPSIEKFTEIDALAKSYINATRMIGQDKIVVPNKNSTEEVWEEAYAKLGRPETPDQYKNVLIDGAMYHMYMMRDNIEQSDRSARAFEEGIDQMRSILINRYIRMRDTRVSDVIND